MELESKDSVTKDNVAWTTKRRSFSNDVDDDSDSDDSILLQKSAFRKKRKPNQDSKAKKDRYLEQAIHSCEKRNKQERAISELQRKTNGSDSEIFDASVEPSLDDKLTRKTYTRALLEGRDVRDGAIQNKNRRLALDEATDTLQTSPWGTRSTLAGNETVAFSSRNQLLDYLERILHEEANQFSKPLHAWLLTNLYADSLDRNLSRSKARQRLMSENPPQAFVQWLIVAASVQPRFEEVAKGLLSPDLLSEGAYQLLIGFSERPGRNIVFTLEDFRIQLDTFFSLCLAVNGRPAPAKKNTKRNDQYSHTTAVSISRFLNIWNTMMKRRMVSFVSLDVSSKTMCNTLLTLLLVGLDPLFEHSFSRSRDAQHAIQCFVSNLFECIEERGGNSGGSALRTLDREIKNAVSGLGAGLDEDSADPAAWLCSSRIIRFILMLKKTTDSRHQICLCTLQSLVSSQSWDIDMKETLRQWEAPSDCNTADWESLAFGILALKHLRVIVSPNEDGSKCLAIAELSYACLHYAARQENLRLQQNDKKDITSSLKIPLEDYEKVCSDIAAKSNSLAINDPHFQRLNYFITCIRQYPRLEKESVGVSHKNSVYGQRKLDSWISH